MGGGQERPCYVLLPGACYANGHGTQQDYTKVLRHLEQINWNCPNGFYLLGKLYCNGSGVPADVAKGVECLRKPGHNVDAREALKHYKKTFFGGTWVRQ